MIRILRFVLLFVIITLTACSRNNNASNKMESVNPKTDTIQNTQVKNNPDNPDFDAQKCIGLSNESLKTWCNQYLKADSGVIDTTGCFKLFSIIQFNYSTNPYEVNWMEDGVVFYRSLVHRDYYLMVFPLSNDNMGNDRLSLVIDKADYTIVNCIEESGTGWFVGITRFGNYFMLSSTHETETNDSEWASIVNDNFKEMENFTIKGTEYSNEEDFGSHRTNTFQINGQSLTVHSDLSVKNKKGRDSLSIDILYAIKQDTILCMEPQKLKEIDKWFEKNGF